MVSRLPLNLNAIPMPLSKTQMMTIRRMVLVASGEWFEEKCYEI